MTKGEIAKRINKALNKHNGEMFPDDFYKFRPYSMFEFSGLQVNDKFIMYSCEQFTGCIVEAVIDLRDEPDNKSDFYSRLMTFDDIMSSSMHSIEINVFHSSVPDDRIIITDINNK